MGKSKSGEIGRAVKLFDGTNYSGWKQDVEMYLKANGLAYLLKPIPAEHIRTPIPQPAPPPIITPPPSPQNNSATNISVNSTDQTLTYHRLLDEWKERETEDKKLHDKAQKKREEWTLENEQLVGSLYFVIASKYRDILKTGTSIGGVFTQMDEMFLREDRIRKLEYKELYNTFKFKVDNRDINAQFVHYEGIMDKCMELGIPIQDNLEKYEYLQMALPQTYRTFCSTYFTVQSTVQQRYLAAKRLVIEKWELDNVELELTKKVKNLNHKGDKKDKAQGEKALIGQDKAQNKKGENKQGGGGGGGGGAKKAAINTNTTTYGPQTCVNCGKSGHYAARCPDDLTPAGVAFLNKYRKNLRERGNKQQAHIAAAEEEEEEDEEVEEEPELGITVAKKKGHGHKPISLLAISTLPTAFPADVEGEFGLLDFAQEDPGNSRLARTKISVVTKDTRISRIIADPDDSRNSATSLPDAVYVRPRFSRTAVVPDEPGELSILRKVTPGIPGAVKVENGHPEVPGPARKLSKSARDPVETGNVRSDPEFREFRILEAKIDPQKPGEVAKEMEMDGNLEIGNPEVGNLTKEVKPQFPLSPIKTKLSPKVKVKDKSNELLNCPAPMSSFCLYKNGENGTGLVSEVNTSSHVGFVESDPSIPSLYTVTEGSEGGVLGGHEFLIPRARLGMAITCLNEKTYPQQESVMQSGVVVWAGDVVNHLAPERETVFVEDDNLINNCFVSPTSLHIDDFEFAPRDRAPVSPSNSPNIPLSVPQQIYYAGKKKGGIILDMTYDWVLDTGATSHMCNNESYFTSLTKRESAVDGLGSAKALGYGTVSVTIIVEGEETSVTLSNTLYIPSLPVNLISLTTLDKKGYYFDNKEEPVVKKRDTGKTILEGFRGGRLYILKRPTPNPPEIDIALPAVEDLKLWHERLGHIGTTRLVQMANGAADGMNLKGEQAALDCDVCKLGKAQRAPIHNHQVERATKPGELIHWDTCGPMDVPSHHKKRYLVLGVDDYTRECFPHFVAKKSDADEAIRATIQEIETQLGPGTVKRIHSDGGGEFEGKELLAFFKEKGIKHTCSAPDTPEHNGVAERKLKSIVSNARCMLIHSGLPKQFWAEATQYAAIIENCCLTKANDNVSPHELWYQEKPDVKDFRVFGSLSMVLNHQHKKKFSVWTKDTIYLGPALREDGHRLYNPDTGKFFASRTVFFREGQNKPKSPLLQDSSSEGESTSESSGQSSEEGDLSSSDESGADNEWEMPSIDTIKRKNRTVDLEILFADF